MNKRTLITAALPYANGPLHFGHLAGAYLPADVYARFLRLQQEKVLFICGSDEYGFAISMSAEMAGRSPKEHVEIFHHLNQQFFQKLQISFDHYSRTTWSGHAEPVQQFFLDLLANGYIEERVTDQLFSEADQQFLADRYVVGECPKCGFAEARGDECPKCGACFDASALKFPKSKKTRAPLVLKPTKHWFLLLEKFRTTLLEWLAQKNWKPNVVHFVKGYIEEIHARAITRDSKWGVPIPLPGTEDKVLYVWFDAPIGYITATQEWANKTGNAEAWKEYWLSPDTHLVQFVGKDNIPFHAAIFPAMTMGQNLPYKLVDALPANEFYHLEGRKFSKSDGWFLDMDHFLRTYTADQIRYTIASQAPETSDSSFTWKGFQRACNGDLLGKYGNLVNRVLVFAHRTCGGTVPAPHALEEMDKAFLERIQKALEEGKEHFSTFRMRKAAESVMELAQATNMYFDAKKPWQDAKTNSHRMETTLHLSLQAIGALALLSWPIIPETADKVWSMLGFSGSLVQIGWGELARLKLSPGQTFGKIEVLFQKIEDETIMKEEATLFAQLPKEVPPAIPLSPLKAEISYTDFAKLDLRVGVIRAAEPIAKSKKLLKLRVDIGLEERTIVSGIAHAFSPENLLGKTVIVVANLQAATLMGVESQGMLLAGQDGAGLHLVTVPSTTPGIPIT